MATRSHAATPARAPRARAAPVRAAPAVALGLLALVLGMRAWLEWVGPLPGDRWSARVLIDRPIQGGPLYALADLFTELATPLAALAQIAVAVAFAVRRLGREDVLTIVLAPGVVVLNAVLKVTLGPTPLWSDVLHRHDHNFPSGHAAFAAAFYGALALVALRRGRREVAAFLVVCIAIMGPTRLIGGGHLSSDVIAGYLVGAAWLLLATAAARAASRARGGRRSPIRAR